jgi:hypothetical protein
MQLADVLELPQTSWDKRIAADLTAEMEWHLAEKVSTIPEMRRFLEVKGSSRSITTTATRWASRCSSRGLRC